MMNDVLINVREDVKQEIAFRKDVGDDELRRIIMSFLIRESERTYMTKDEKAKNADEIFNSLRRLGKLEPLLSDESITEIMINGHEDVFVEKNGKIIKLEIVFREKEELENIIQKIVSKVNRTVNQANPIVDARLSDGSRVNIVLDPVAINGPILTIRKFSKNILGIKNLLENGTLNDEVATFLERLVREKYNIFISGGTGTGKTTLLNILSNFIPESERIITIEDSAELNIMNILNLISLETRNKNTEGHGEITIKDLIKTALRMRPDRIIVGEVRGKETVDMLQAMNTGHDGSLSTGHANSAKDMLTRLETMALMDQSMPLEAISRQIASAIDVIVHISKVEGGRRIISEIIEIEGYFNNKIKIKTLYEYDGQEIVKKAEISEKRRSCYA